MGATDTYVLLRAFVDELARCGMRVACTSPGSRCAPLVLTLARERRLECYSHVDERCAGFFALGAAKASGLPVAVACTSGTAAAELLPAAVEAREARVPLLLLSADRPPELRENGAGQAIDQLKIFGDAAKWFFEVGTHDDIAGPARLRWIRTLACRAYWTALEDGPGVVHLNFPLREPLIADADPLPADETGKPGGRPYVLRPPAPAVGETRLGELVAEARRGVLVAGRHERWPIRGCERSECLPDRSPLGSAAAAFCEAIGWPLLADPLSGARRGAAAVAHYDALLREEAFVGARRPDLVLRVGDLPVSKPLRAWLAGLENVRQVALDPEGAWQDPASVLSDSLALEPAAALAELTASMAAPADEETMQTENPAPLSPASSDWLASWRSADEQAAEAILGVLDGDELDEPSVAAELGVLLPEEATLFVASSMPVRDIETFWPVREDPPRVLCNRGANGIDGTVSSAFGAVAAADGPVVLLIGDVALAHDIGGLLAATRLGLKLTIVLLDNDGGGIFDFLAVARAAMARESDRNPRAEDGASAREGADIYTRHVATPTGLDFARVAALYGLVHEPVHTVPDFRAALERALAPQAGSTLIHARSDRAANVELHSRVWQAVSRACTNGDAMPAGAG
ncbi:MAG TPA: 2-succinyl-5-enolpyruvyl-6-hydroxy-3-cyclohexene-1-carboxylic-acid synthase [Solirubrobacteraceae bacterium]|jgi:2-succinyl-5-enolpyruvyl-6-hydroxy-3-cyclohexene-1-carboxylate synthase|nr:2-succinyl-5-enolpyruvyl-6-hydroxy-3-cyclohexene-1-carboxylic-acid synthase [Solirubrobacteraceae bacterium]